MNHAPRIKSVTSSFSAIQVRIACTDGDGRDLSTSKRMPGAPARLPLSACKQSGIGQGVLPQAVAFHRAQTWIRLA